MCSRSVFAAVVQVYSMNVSAVVNPRTSCPHADASLVPFETRFSGQISNGATLTLSANDALLLSSCSIPAGVVLSKIAISFSIGEINVAQGGSFLAGSPTCKLFSNIQITFTGTKTASSPAVNTAPSKGIVSSGTVSIHGKQFNPTWTRLAVAARAGDTTIVLQDPVNWEVGQKVLIATSSFFDCPSKYATWCAPCKPWELSANNAKCQAPTYYPHRNEIRTITAISDGTVYRGFAVRLDSPLSFGHYSGSEYQTEVALLSRRINLVGEQTNDQFGAHLMVTGNSGLAQVSGVGCDNCGQLNVLGRYPFHLHLMGEAPNSYFEDCSVTNSNFRAYVIHGTNSSRLSRNVGYNIDGFAVYLEDGVEERNLIECNFMAHVHPISRPANGGFGQGGEQFVQSANLLVPADTSASGFYISNAYNDIIGNAASGGWSGFAFPNLPKPIGDFRGQGFGNNNPLNRPTKTFRGNTAHSSGFYWQGHGNGIYVGAWLTHDAASPFNLRYDSGRNSRDTKTSSGASAIMVFEDTKMWATNKGIAHWGNTLRARGLEVHDMGQPAAMLFGEGAVVDALFNAFSGNTEGSKWQTTAMNLGLQGFQFYDTWVKAILSRVTFRNFGAAGTAVRYMDHSDHYTPQGINAVRGLRFQNVSRANVVAVQNCGAPDCAPSTVTHSARIYSVWDFEGSLAYAPNAGVPSIMGSNFNWWNAGADCAKDADWKLWRCPWKSNRNVAHLQIQIPGLATDSCNSTYGANCTDQYSPYTVGYATRFGATKADGISIPPWAALTGLGNTGWYIRPEMTAPGFTVSGAPAEWTVGSNFNIGRGEFVVLAMAYPANTQFTINIESVWWQLSGQNIKYPDIPMASSKSLVLSSTEDIRPSSEFVCTGNWYDFCTNIYRSGSPAPGLGAWFFENIDANTGMLYIRIVSPAAYNANQKSNAETQWTYQEDQVKVPRISGGFLYRIKASHATAPFTSYAGGVNKFFTVADTIPSAFPDAAGTQVAATPSASSSSLTCSRGTVLNGGAPQTSNPFGPPGGAASALAASVTVLMAALLLFF